MKITLNNVAKIKHAEVEIKGITVIAGENNTGKSTVGKALYAIFNSFYNVKDQIYNERVENAVSILQSMMRQSFGMMSAKFIADMEDVAKNLIDNREIFLVDQSVLEEYIENYMENYDGLSMQQEEKTREQNMWNSYTKHLKSKMIPYLCLS
jgi:predicted ATPase